MHAPALQLGVRRRILRQFAALVEQHQIDFSNSFFKSFTENIFTPDKYNLDFVREKTKAYLTYLISLFESNVLNIREKAIWGSMGIYFYTIDSYVPHGNGYMHIISIHESELNNEFFTIFNQKFNRCKENFITFVPLNPFKFETVVNFNVFHN